MTRTGAIAGIAVLSLAACRDSSPPPSSGRAAVVKHSETGTGGAAEPAATPAEIEPPMDPRKPPKGVKRPRIEGEQDCRRDPEACVRRAVTLTRTDLARAAGLFGVACEEENAAACGNLAVLLRDGRGIARDRTRAEQLMGVACKDGHGPSCDNAKALARMP